jgi:hypothetical protein
VAGIDLGRRYLRPSGRQMFYRDEEVLTTFALKAVFLHVVGKIRKLRIPMKVISVPG